jgi:hypothetical protein
MCLRSSFQYWFVYADTTDLGNLNNVLFITGQSKLAFYFIKINDVVGHPGLNKQLFGIVLNPEIEGHYFNLGCFPH